MQILKLEKLTKDNAWRCDGCKRLVQATKKMSVWDAPNVLVIHLKRFTYGKGKITKPIEYTEFLSVPEGSLQPRASKSKKSKGEGKVEVKEEPRDDC